MKKIKSFISKYWIVLFITAISFPSVVHSQPLASIPTTSYSKPILNVVYLEKFIKVTVTDLPPLVSVEKIRVIDGAGLAAIFETTADIFVVVDRATTITTGALPLPPNPIDGQVIGVSSRVAITNFSQDSGPQAIPVSGPLTTLAVGGAAAWCYDLGSNRWFRMP